MTRNRPGRRPDHLSGEKLRRYHRRSVKTDISSRKREILIHPEDYACLLKEDPPQYGTAHLTNIRSIPVVRS